MKVPKPFLGNELQKDGRRSGGPGDVEKLQMSRYPENRTRMKNLPHIEDQNNKTQQDIMFQNPWKRKQRNSQFKLGEHKRVLAVQEATRTFFFFLIFSDLNILAVHYSALVYIKKLLQIKAYFKTQYTVSFKKALMTTTAPTVS